MRLSRSEKEFGRGLFFTSGIEVGCPAEPGWNQLRAFPESQGLNREPGQRDRCHHNIKSTRISAYYSLGHFHLPAGSTRCLGMGFLWQAPYYSLLLPPLLQTC